MFALPNAKRVRREELYSPPSSPRSSPDPALTDIFRSRIQQTFDTTAVATENDADASADADTELEFRLFAQPSHSAASSAPQKIRLRSPSLERREPGLVNPHRDRGYYFASPASAERLAELESAAVSGAGVLKRARIRWPGCALSWRVTRVVVPGGKQAVAVEDRVEGDGVAKRRRPGKKRRVVLRKRAAREKMGREEAGRREKEKEEAEREKRTRRNREKKVKKKEREKAKKVAAKEGEGGEGGDEREGGPGGE